MRARIYKPGKSAMQSGTARTKDWVLDYEPEDRRTLDPLTGWTSSSDMGEQVRLEFNSKDAAIAFAVKQGLAYTARDPAPRRATKKSYADNFCFGRKQAWTH